MNMSMVTFDDFTDLDLLILWELFDRVEAANWRVKFLGDWKSSKHKR